MGWLTVCFFTSIILPFIISLSLFQITVAHESTSVKQLCHDEERSALFQFKKGLSINESASGDPDAYPKFASWKQDSDCCSWDGIKCNDETGHVIKLDLASGCIHGSINFSSSLFHLIHLEWLSLADNDFNHSKFPSGIGKLSRLSHLNLSHSAISGQILPEIMQLSMLVTLDLSNNFFSGKVPPSIGNLTKLDILDLYSNHFFGKLPASTGSLASLREINIHSNSFSGQLPPSLGNLTKLKRLNLSPNNFSRQHSTSLSWISKLTELAWLVLTGANLFGEIPSWLMNQTQLTVLVFDQNQLTGPIPNWLMNVNQLQLLSNMSNQLTGHFPSQIGNLTQLSALDLSSNQLQGPIPGSITELKHLQYLDLRSNNLSGSVEIEMLVRELESLTVLFLSWNNLSLLTRNTANFDIQNKFVLLGLGSCELKEFPNFLRNQDQLELLDLSANKITGKIPGWFLNASVGSLQTMNLSHNLLRGFDQHPVVLPWTRLVALDLRSNKLQGPLPVPQSSTIQYLVSKNMLTGKLPPSICNLNKLQVLDLSHNNLTGGLPQCLGNFSYLLSVLDLQKNKFYGSIPEIFMNATNLRMIDLSHNSLQGRVPRSLANCAALEFLDLGNNQITDIFPSWLGNLTELKVLMLQSNRFHGAIREPETNFEFPKLQIIDLSHNKFSGKLPSKYFQCWNAIKFVNASQLTYMQQQPRQSIKYMLPDDGANIYDYSFQYSYDYSITMSNKGIELEYEKVSNMLSSIVLSNNGFTGEIPESITSLKGLNCLNLSSNNLFGHIPSSLGNLKVLESLDLSNNNLSGEIPQQLAELTYLEVFDASSNHLSGPIPQGKQFDTFEKSSFEGNPGLCGKQLSKECENTETSPSHNEDQDSDDETPFEFGWKIVVTGYASGLIIGVALGHICTTRKHEWFANTAFGRQIKGLRRNRRYRN